MQLFAGLLVQETLARCFERKRFSEFQVFLRTLIAMGTATPQKIGNMVSALEGGLISPTEVICRAT